MNEEKLTQEEIQKILEEHQLWLCSGREEGERANFSGVNLREVNLREVNLRGAILEGAIFEGAILLGANLRRANLERANLKSAKLEGANLESANLESVNLESANLESANLERANLKRANLKRANLLETILLEAKLEGADLRGAILEGAILLEANLEGADLRGADLRGAILLGANLKGANLKGANLKGANLKGANLKEAILEGTSGITRAITDAAVLESNLRQHEQTINQLQQQLQAAQNSHEQVEELQKELQEAQNSKQQIEAQLQQLQEQNKKLKGELNSRIGDAKKSLANALINTENQIKSNCQSAKWFGITGITVFVIASLVLFGIPIYIWCTQHFPANSWHMVFYTFPVIAMILIATTLLRHQKALLNEVRHFSMMKHQIELYSGLLEASQHAAASMGDPEKADRYVQETFTQIRNRLLSAQAQQEHHQAADGREDDTASDKIVNLLDKIADLANKKPS